MALNKDPVFAGAPLFASVAAVTANAALDGTGTVSTILTAGADGSVVTALKAFCRATVTATALRLFVSIDGGTTKSLIDDKLMAAHAIGSGGAQPGVVFVSKLNPDEAIWLPPAAILYGSIAVALAGGIQFSAEYRNLSAT